MIERAAILLALATAAWLAYTVFARWHRHRASRALPATDRGRAILYFRSDHCAPCAAQWQFLQQAIAAVAEPVRVQKIDADVDRETADRYGVFTLPTTLIVDANGTVRHANYGLVNAHRLAQQLHNVN